MLSSHNILSPANGQPIAIPSQDIVLGCYYLTSSKRGTKGEGRAFANIDEDVSPWKTAWWNGSRQIFLRYTGPLMDLTTQYDDQAVMRAECGRSRTNSSTPRSAA